MLTCHVEGCSSEVHAHLLCRHHYERQRRYGTTDRVRDMRTGPKAVPYCWVGVPSLVCGPQRRIGVLRLYPARSAQEAWEMLREVREAQDERGVCVAGDLADLGVRREVSFAELHDGPMRLE